MGTASSGGLWHDAHHRGDVTNWVTEQELQAAGQPLLASVIQLLSSLRPQLMQRGFDVSGRCSVQLACYPGGGARYVRHAGASAAIPDRTVTALLYLNTDWNTQCSKTAVSWPCTMQLTAGFKGLQTQQMLLCLDVWVMNQQRLLLRLPAACLCLTAD
eukprot:GHUV01016418.1.p1 GENE.GHUV01016418.1~~GHUV01016418.1.p1  ORF type:complete len:158 (+),score=45.13 GHUV01016418.1:1213-1686(+)